MSEEVSMVKALPANPLSLHTIDYNRKLKVRGNLGYNYKKRLNVNY